MTRTCEQCGKSFEATRARFCGATCRSRVHRSPRRRAPGSTPGRRGRSFESVVRAELKSLGELESMRGQQALVMARRMSDAGETGAAAAALSRELSRVMALITASVAGGDIVDEIQERRDRKAREAGA